MQQQPVSPFTHGDDELQCRAVFYFSDGEFRAHVHVKRFISHLEFFKPRELNSFMKDGVVVASDEGGDCTRFIKSVSGYLLIKGKWIQN